MRRDSFVFCLSLALGCASLQAGQDTAPAPKPDYPKLFAGLTGADANERLSAAKKLLEALNEPVQKAGKPWLGKLKKDLLEGKDPAAPVKTLAETLTLLRASKNPETVATFRNLDAADPNVRHTAETALVARLNEYLENLEITKYIDDLGSPDAAVVKAAQDKLKALGAAAASDLVSALDDEHPQVKKNAAAVLLAMGPAAKEVAVELMFLLDNEDKSTRQLAASVLENLGPEGSEVASNVADYLTHDDHGVRDLAAGILKKMGPGAKEASDELVELLTGKDQNARDLATGILVNVGPAEKEATEDLVKIVGDPAADADSRERAAKVLGSIGSAAKDAIPDLTQHANDANPKVSAAVQQALIKILGK